MWRFYIFWGEKSSPRLGKRGSFVFFQKGRADGGGVTPPYNQAFPKQGGEGSSGAENPENCPCANRCNIFENN